MSPCLTMTCVKKLWKSMLMSCICDTITTRARLIIGNSGIICKYLYRYRYIGSDIFNIGVGIIAIGIGKKGKRLKREKGKRWKRERRKREKGKKGKTGVYPFNLFPPEISKNYNILIWLIRLTWSLKQIQTDEVHFVQVIDNISLVHSS